MRNVRSIQFHTVLFLGYKKTIRICLVDYTSHKMIRSHYFLGHLWVLRNFLVNAQALYIPSNQFNSSRNI